MLKQRTITVMIIVISIFHYTGMVQAAPLPKGTQLGLDMGGVDGAGNCNIGSCAGLHAAPNFGIIWSDIGPGNEGGFVVGENQLSGGQELAPSDTNTTPGDIIDAWFYFGAYGTFSADNALNTFSDTSNDGTTVINDLNWAWNGSSIPLGGGTVIDYTINLDGAGGGNWSLFYIVIVPSGQFTGVEFGLFVRGSVVVPPVDPTNNAPVVNDVFIGAEPEVVASWTPDFSDDAGDTHTCAIEANALNGHATVNADCSGGTYTSGSGFTGPDRFSYRVTDQGGLFATANVNVENVYIYTDPCVDAHPLKRVTTVGGGQSAIINASLQVIFTGHITTESGLTTGGKSAVKICPGTTVDFETVSTDGAASCLINSAVTASNGTLAIGDKLICTNKPDASDTDRFSIKSGL